MPELLSLERKYAGLEDRFVVLAIHQHGPSSVESAASKARARSPKVKLPSALILDQAEGGISHEYDPKALGDMKLINPQGYVVATGSGSLSMLDGELAKIQRKISAASRALIEFKQPAKMVQGIEALYALGLHKADEAALAGFACPDKIAPVVFEALAKRAAARLRLVGEDGLGHRQAKRRRAAKAALEKHPGPELIAPLMAYAVDRRVKSKDAEWAVQLAEKIDPTAAVIEETAISLCDDGTTPQRRMGAGILARRTTASATARLLQMLTSDKATSVRALAARLLGERGGAGVIEALRKSATDDKAKSVRAAAKAALDKAGGASAGD